MASGLLAVVAAIVLVFPVARAQATNPDREFGVAVDPWRVDEWAAAVGVVPSMVMGFEAFSKGRTIDHHFAEVRRQGCVPSWSLGNSACLASH